MDAGSTRRQLIARWLAIGGAAALLAPPLGVDAALTAPQTDAQVLADAFAVEQLVAFAYARVLASGALSAGVRRTVAEVLAQEHEHAAALAALLDQLGTPLPAGPTGVAAADKALAADKVSVSLAGLRSQRDCLKLLIDVESVAEGTYFVAVSKLRDATALRLSAEIMANEAQHWSALTELRLPGDLASAVPSPFVEGYP